ncbi:MULTISPECIES: FecR family protein [Brevundimonas]|uniref:FecR family protein n=1 Tax=Brevundimonas TaxID=41275 RepID=UPI0019088394|nr:MULTISPECIES: FecR domain-containing protein [Brevundimonas]
MGEKQGPNHPYQVQQDSITLREKRDHSRTIDAAAADWVARVDAGPLSAEKEKELEDWLAGDIRRVGAYARAQAYSIHGERAAALGGTFDGDRIEGRRTSHRPTRRRMLHAGGVGLAAGLAGAVLLTTSRGVAHATAKGEIRRVPLDDGSTVTLNTETRIRVFYGAQKRHVVLQSGEAFFEVIHEPDRPFSVEAGDLHIQAIGTTFAVSRLSQRPVAITVSTGEVTAVADGAPDPKPIRIGPNSRAQAVAATGSVSVAPLEPDNLTRSLAWREGKLAFEGQTIEQAALEFSRYSTTTIEIVGPALAQERVIGLFSANDPVGFSRSIALTFDASVRVERNRVILSR